MVFHQCIRCDKQIRKYVKKIGFGADYIRVFLKAEHGLCDEELNNGYLCNPCRSFIYGVVHRPGPGKSTSDPSSHESVDWWTDRNLLHLVVTLTLTFDLRPWPSNQSHIWWYKTCIPSFRSMGQTVQCRELPASCSLQVQLPCRITYTAQLFMTYHLILMDLQWICKRINVNNCFHHALICQTHWRCLQVQVSCRIRYLIHLILTDQHMLQCLGEICERITDNIASIMPQ